MPNFAGFAAVAELRDTTVNQILRIYHASAVFPTAVARELSVANPLGPGNASIAVQAFLDLPLLTLSAAAQDRLIVDLRLVGELRISAPQIGSRTQRIMLSTRVRARPVAEVQPDGVQLHLSAEGIQFDSFDLRVLEGQPLPDNVNTFLQAPATRAALSSIVQGVVDTIGPLSTPLFVPLLEQIGVGSAVHISRLVVRVLDGAIAVGLDLRAGSFALDTFGDPAAIVKFLSKSDLAVCANPALAPLIALMVRPKAAAAADDAGVTLDDFWMRVEGDYFRVGGHAKKKLVGDTFGASFELSARPMLGRPDHIEHYDEEYGGQYTVVTPGSTNIWIDVFDVELDTELPWWVYLGIGIASALTLPMAPVVLLSVISVIDSIRGNIVRSIEAGVENGSSPSRTQRITLPKTDAPFVDVTVSQLVVSNNGIQSRAWFTPQYGPERVLEGRGTITPEEMLGDPLVYRLAPAPELYHPDDPSVRIRWQIRRGDTNAVVLSQELSSTTPGAKQVVLDLKQGTLRQCNAFPISVRVYRSLGTQTEELINHSGALTVLDRLERKHPYVRWNYVVNAPQVKIYPNGARQVQGYHSLQRKSVIHRTVVPGRCRFADQYTYKVTPDELQYLDTLPFPTSQLQQHRRELCPYCFFGGPDKTQPLIPT